MLGTSTAPQKTLHCKLWRNHRLQLLSPADTQMIFLLSPNPASWPCLAFSRFPSSRFFRTQSHPNRHAFHRTLRRRVPYSWVRPCPLPRASTGPPPLSLLRLSVSLGAWPRPGSPEHEGMSRVILIRKRGPAVFAQHQWHQFLFLRISLRLRLDYLV